MAGYQPEKHFFYSTMTVNYNFCLQEDNARRLQPASHLLSLAVPKVPSPLIGVTFTITP